MKNQIFGSIVLFAFINTGCTDSGSKFKGVSYKDKRNLISFSISKNWILKNELNGMRFGRANSQNERSTIVVNASSGDLRRSLKKHRKIGKKQIQQQNAEIITDKSYPKNGFSVWESEFKLRNQSRYLFNLFSVDVRVEVKLIALTEHYPNYIPDIKSVVESIRAN